VARGDGGQLARIPRARKLQVERVQRLRAQRYRTRGLLLSTQILAQVLTITATTIMATKVKLLLMSVQANANLGVMKKKSNEAMLARLAQTETRTLERSDRKTIPNKWIIAKSASCP